MFLMMLINTAEKTGLFARTAFIDINFTSI